MAATTGPIEEAALNSRHQQLVIDGEAVVLGADGIADFNALHSRRHDEEAQLNAFDILATLPTVVRTCFPGLTLNEWRQEGRVARPDRST